MNSDFKPDFGLFYKEMFGDNMIHNFYNVLIFDFNHVGHNSYSFTSNVTWAEQEYAATFDFAIDKLKYLIRELQDDSLTSQFKKILLKEFTQPNKVSFRDDPISVDVEAELGTPVKSLYETFIPFLVTEFSNAKILRSKN